MEHIRLYTHRAIFLLAFFVAIAGLSACGGGSSSGTTTTTTTTGSGVTGTGA